MLPVEQIAALCRERGVPLIVDASQSAGCLPVRMKTLGAAFIAMPGHKGLYGPQGTGLLLCNAQTVPLLEGGTGSASARQEMPDFLPDRLEAGTHNICGIAGLLEGIRFVRSRGEGAIVAHERRLIEAAGELSVMPGVWAYCDQTGSCQAGVLSFHIPRLDCETAAEALGRRGIAVRAGLHCAPLAHQTAGTFERGTIRASVSAFNTLREMECFLHAVRHLSGGR